MYIIFDQLLDAATVEHMQTQLKSAHWQDGRFSAGVQAKTVKHNLQLSSQDETAQALSKQIELALKDSARFFSATLPKNILMPKFNCYTPEYPSYGWHVDNAIRVQSDQKLMRADLSVTIFLTPPDEYLGGELIIQEADARHRFKLAAGSAVVYSAHTKHQVTPVTQGQRLACFFWIESLIANPIQRQLLHDLDNQIIGLQHGSGNDQISQDLTGIYHQLLGMWATP